MNRGRTRATINVALKILGVAGLTAVVVLAPNAVQALEKLMRKSPAKDFDPQRLLNELKRQDLVVITQSGDQVAFNLSPAGAHRLQQVIVDELKIPTPSKWDKRWRLVAFDIPTSQSRQRQKFVEQLQSLNFVMLQKSLWVHPFPCFDQIEQLAGHYNVLRHCSLMEVAKLDEISTGKLTRRFRALI